MGSLKINKLILAAKICKKLTAINRKRISMPSKMDSREGTSAPFLAQKGHFVVYTADQIRFAIPLVYLNNKVFKKLLKLSEDEFGLQGNGPITLPCDAYFMEHLIMLIRGGSNRNLGKALLLTIGSTHCHSRCLSTASHEEQRNQRLLLCHRLVEQSCS